MILAARNHSPEFLTEVAFLLICLVNVAVEVGWYTICHPTSELSDKRLQSPSPAVVPEDRQTPVSCGPSLLTPSSSPIESWCPAQAEAALGSADSKWL